MIEALPFMGIITGVVPNALGVLIVTYTAFMTPVASHLCRDRMVLH